MAGGQEKVIRRLMETATLECTITRVSTRLDWGRADDDNAVSANERIMLLGNINNTTARPVVGDMQAQIDFYYLSAAGQLEDDEVGNPTLGLAKYHAAYAGDREFLWFGVPCTEVYFDKVRTAIVQHPLSPTSRLTVTFMVSNFPEEWRPEEPVAGKPSFWINHVSLNWLVDGDRPETGDP